MWLSLKMSTPNVTQASTCDTVTIVVVSIVAAMIVALLGIVIWQIVKYNKDDSDSDDDNDNGNGTKQSATAASRKNKNKNKNNKQRFISAKKGPHQPLKHQRQQRRRYGVANPRATPHHEPMYDQPAAMPVEQLTSPTYMPPILGEKRGEPTSSLDMGDSPSDKMGTEAQGTTSNNYMDSNYLQDPGMMTPSTATDIKGLQTFMPYMGGGVGGNDKDGPVDPNTGLPLFTTNKLVRSQLLGGIGSGSFLRQQQDPLSGYRKNVGRLMCGAQQGRRDIEMRRKQFNASRLECGGENDPVLFNVGEFAYV